MEEGSFNGSERKGILRHVNAINFMNLVAFSMAVYHLYKAYFGVYEVWRHRGIHLTFLLLLAFTSKGLCVTYRSRLKKAWDVLLILLSIGIGVYMVISYEEIGLRAGMPDMLDKVSCVVLACLAILAVYRTLGLPMTTVTLVFALYVIFGQHLPVKFAHAGYSFNRLVDIFFNSTDGILGLPTGVSAVYVAIFIYFGTFLLKSGAADYFKDLAFALAGSRQGGPAKVAVVASALVGTMMGSGVANIMTTGSFTIPMMKKLGYQSHFAGAVEAVASLGGQIMPPIMASVIFLIAEYTGEPLFNLLIWSFLPAFMYFFCLFWGVHFEAIKRRLTTVPKAELPKLKAVLFKGPWYLLFPLPILVALLFIGYSPFYSAFLSIIALLICAAFHSKSRMGPRRIHCLRGHGHCLRWGEHHRGIHRNNRPGLEFFQYDDRPFRRSYLPAPYLCHAGIIGPGHGNDHSGGLYHCSHPDHTGARQHGCEHDRRPSFLFLLCNSVRDYPPCGYRRLCGGWNRQGQRNENSDDSHETGVGGDGGPLFVRL
jgi:TRAP transporter 4TM/12TM fusion protein